MADCPPHAFPSDPQEIRVVSTYGRGAAEVEYTCPTCGSEVTGELLASQLRPLSEHGSVAEVAGPEGSA